MQLNKNVLLIFFSFICRTLLALGYHIGYDPQHTSNTRLKTLKLPNKWVYNFSYYFVINVHHNVDWFHSHGDAVITWNQTIFFYFSYLQENGYKPTPLDLSQIMLNKRMLELVELLAQNTHNVWAKDRIRQGWTYGLHEIRVCSL